MTDDKFFAALAILQPPPTGAGALAAAAVTPSTPSTQPSAATTLTLKRARPMAAPAGSLPPLGAAHLLQSPALCMPASAAVLAAAGSGVRAAGSSTSPPAARPRTEPASLALPARAASSRQAVAAAGAPEAASGRRREQVSSAQAAAQARAVRFTPGRGAPRLSLTNNGNGSDAAQAHHRRPCRPSDTPPRGPHCARNVHRLRGVQRPLLPVCGAPLPSVPGNVPICPRNDSACDFQPKRRTPYLRQFFDSCLTPLQLFIGGIYLDAGEISPVGSTSFLFFGVCANLPPPPVSRGSQPPSGPN